jgi:curli production assembly/transport component CsgG
MMRTTAIVCTVVQLGACTTTTLSPSTPNASAVLTPTTSITRDLLKLPVPKARLPVAVYGLRDQTGQYKPSPDSSYSTSVTQGAASILAKALKDSGWYIPVEREGLQNLLTERKIVRAVESPTEKGKPGIELPVMLPASMIMEGGVIAYESNVRTGGTGASYLGIGTNRSYRVDQVTVSLRSVDTRNGQMLGVVTLTKTIYSYQLSANVYAFTAYQKLLQGESGISSNEPVQLGVIQALEAAVIQLTLQGVRDGFLELKNPRDIYLPLVQKYLQADQANANEPDEAPTAPIGVSEIPIDSQIGVVIPFVLPKMLQDPQPSLIKNALPSQAKPQAALPNASAL